MLIYFFQLFPLSIFSLYLKENLSEYPYEKRKRTRISRFQFDDVDPEEQRMLQQALRNSIKDTKVQDQHVPDAPVYYPTLEQFKDPLGYIKRYLNC